DSHMYYKSSFYPEVSRTWKEYWLDLTKDPESHTVLPGAHRKMATIYVTFDFPFYGHIVNNVTIATGGFLYMGDYLQDYLNALAAKQYAAPLLADFDTMSNPNSSIRYKDNGTALTVQWDQVVIHKRTDLGSFTFQLILKNTGDVLFVYKDVPVNIRDINDNKHPVRVGLYDAYTIEKTLFYEYSTGEEYEDAYTVDPDRHMKSFNGTDIGITNPTEDSHMYYNSSFYPEVSGTWKEYWLDLKKDPESHTVLPGAHRKTATIYVTFDFPFYGHIVNNVTIATGGFLYMGDYLQDYLNALAAKQYAAPLLADFDTMSNPNSSIRYKDNGTALTVHWDQVVMHKRTDLGSFTFQLILKNTGEVLFVYKDVPVNITDISDDKHPVRVGLYDAYIIEKTLFSIITDDELLTLSNILLYLDEKNPFATPLISLQGKTRSGSQEDLARQPLFGPQTASEAVVSGTSRLIKDLYDNYSPEVNNNEQVTQQHLNEEEAFFQAVLATEPMKRVVALLQSRGLLPTNNRNLESILRTLWFERFSRSRGSLGSSGFEHIFLGEVKNAEPSGFHSWLYFKQQEEVGSLDYLGFIRSAKLSGKASLLELPLKWKGMYKPVNSMFVGTSPELEMALYTLCFYARPEAKCPMNGNSVKFFIQTYPFKSRGKVYLGTAYPTFR
ncbi:hypothetical protein QYM36_007081, partial [Artemia franciscana]